MRWVEVTSSNLKLIGTDGPDLLVQFHGGQQYRYRGAAGEFTSLREAESVGRYFNSNVRDDYPYERIS